MNPPRLGTGYQMAKYDELEYEKGLSVDNRYPKGLSGGIQGTDVQRYLEKQILLPSPFRYVYSKLESIRETILEEKQYVSSYRR
jgi:hypothetical protein